jgi:hypothetical protein
MRAKVRVELNPAYKVNHVSRPLEILPWLQHVNEISVVPNGDLPPLSIVVNNRVIAVVDPFDEFDLNSPCDEGSTIQRVKDLQPSLIFKYQWRRGVDYPPGTISAGYPCVQDVVRPSDLLTRSRSIAVTARMRVNGDYHWAADTEWMKARTRIATQAKLLAHLGHKTKRGLVSTADYIAELWDAQIGFEWCGRGYLTHRLIEYIRAGVVPITRPLGAEWPIREDVILEDGVHCVFCPDPFRFAQEASRLLLDPQKIARIRRNLLKLWEEKLCPKAQGYWLWSKLEPAADLPRSGSFPDPRLSA